MSVHLCSRCCDSSLAPDFEVVRRVAFAALWHVDRYDNFDEDGNWAQDSIPYVLKEFFGGVPSYPLTPFNVIRLSLYQGRAMVMVCSSSCQHLNNHRLHRSWYFFLLTPSGLVL